MSAARRARTLVEALRFGERALGRRGVEDGHLDAELLLARALGTDRLGVLTRDPLATIERAGWRTFVRSLVRRRRREPIAYLLGEREFYSLRFEVGPGVLVPRPETEDLVAFGIERLRGLPAPRLLDVGTGSGNVTAAVLVNSRRASAVAIDRSLAALRYARRNFATLGLSARAMPVALDLRAMANALAPASFDVVLANPPYVEAVEGAHAGELRHEPQMALVDEVEPFPAVYRHCARAAATLLRPGGWLAFEVGRGQAAAVKAVVADAGGYDAPMGRFDLAGIERVVAARRRS